MDTVSEEDYAVPQYQQWCENLRSKAASIAEGDADTIDNLTNNGNIERLLADNHSGRELLELIQNARDEIVDAKANEGDSTPGEIYIGVQEDGLVVANTGSPFDLLEEDVERAVRMVGESNKTDDEGGFERDSNTVGHIGVGLKSILSIGDTFEIWSNVPELSEPLRVRYSRSYLTAAVAQAYGHDIDSDPLERAIHPTFQSADGESLFSATLSDADGDALDVVSGAPLFWYPVALDPGVIENDLARRCQTLVSDGESAFDAFEDPPTESFTTAVYIEFEDDNWRKLLKKLGIEPEKTLDEKPRGNRDAVWEILSIHGEKSSSLDVETLIHFGGVDDFYIEKLGEAESTEDEHAAEHWSIRTDETPTIPHDELGYDRVFVTARVGDGESVHRCFDKFDHLNAPETHVSLLVDRTPDLPGLLNSGDLPEQIPNREGLYDGDRQLEYPLHLYYPIDASRDGRFPFCLHGRFRVSTNRQDFSDDEANQRVLAKGSELVGLVGEACAAASHNDSWWDLYPWVLLPPDPPEAAPSSEPIDAPELVAFLKHEVYTTLRETASLPTDAGTVRPTEALLGTSHELRLAIQSALTIHKNADLRESERDMVGPTLPGRSALEALNSTLDGQSWNSRIEHLAGNPSIGSQLEQWLDWLAANLSSARRESMDLTVEAEAGRRLFQGAIDVLDRYREETDEEIADVLSEYEERFHNVYLLPCRGSDSDLIRLVAIESRRQPQREIGVRGRRSSRTVIWDYETESSDYQYPPSIGEFDVYFIEPACSEGPAYEVLSNAGQAWGIRKGNSRADLYKSLLEPLPHSGTGIDAEQIAGLAEAITSYNESRTETLKTGELAFIDTEHLLEKVRRSGRDRRDERLRTALHGTSVEIVGNEKRIADVPLTPSWARARRLARPVDESDESDTGTDDGSTLAEPADAWLPSPEEATNAWPKVASFDDGAGRLARVFSLLGASRMPGIRYCWLLDRRHHPDPDMQYDDSAPGDANPEWWPSTWDLSKVPTEGGRHQHETLVTALESTDGYRQWVTSGVYKSDATINHNKTCSGTPVGSVGGNGSYLSTWVWFTEEGLAWLTKYPALARVALTQHPDAYRSGLLNTYWHCQNQKNCNYNGRTIPTLANWQLRHIPIWEELIETTDATDAAGWETATLRHAVLKGSGRSRGWQLFPHIDPDQDECPNEEVLADLGVQTLDSLNTSQAALKLQQLQAAFAVGDGLEADHRVRLELPNQSHWNSARSKLLEQILSYIDEQDDVESWESIDLPMLTHLPLRQGGTWYSAPISAISDDESSISEDGSQATVKYLPASPTPWQKLAVSDPERNVYELKREEVAGFEAFTNALGVDIVDAPDPELDLDSFEERLCDQTDLESHLREMRSVLRDRIPLLIAIQELETKESIDESHQELEQAIEGLAVVESLPDEMTEPLSKTGSGLYADTDGEYVGQQGGTGLLLNIGGLREVASAADLATMSWSELVEKGIVAELGMGFALLTENYRARNDFESVLDLSVSKAELIERLKKDTFPIDEVQSHLASDFEHALRRRLRASEALISQTTVDTELPDIEHLVESLKDRPDANEAQLDGGLRTVFIHRTATSDVAAEYVQSVEALPDPYQTLIEALYQETAVDDWREQLRQFKEHSIELVIYWWVENESLLPATLTDDVGRARGRRFLEVEEVDQSMSSSLDTVGQWADALENSSVTFQWSKRVPPELRDEEHSDLRWLELSAERFEDGLSKLLATLEEKGFTQEVVGALENYVRQGKIQPRNSGAFRDESMDRAAEVQSDSDRDFAILEQSSPETGGEAEVAGSASGGGSTTVTHDSGSYTFTGRGEDAEIAMGIRILDRFSQWLREVPVQRYQYFETEWRALYRAQSYSSYAWHREDTWPNLLDVLPRDLSADEIESKVLSWDAALEGGELGETMLFKLLDVSQEDGPGFDMIDPLGPMDDPASIDNLAPAPIEIKAVGRTPPYSIRLTTNEYQQCLNFVRTDGQRYILRLVYVPESEDRVADAQMVREIVLESESDLRAHISRDEFEQKVRQGVLSIDIK
jgi:hypothetical protein